MNLRYLLSHTQSDIQWIYLFKPVGRHVPWPVGRHVPLHMISRVHGMCEKLLNPLLNGPYLDSPVLSVKADGGRSVPCQVQNLNHQFSLKCSGFSEFSVWRKNDWIRVQSAGGMGKGVCLGVGPEVLSITLLNGF